MRLDLFGDQQRWSASRPDVLLIGSQQVPFHLVRNARARRYVVRVRRDGSVRVTVPRGGSVAFAVSFARQSSAWIEQQLKKRQLHREQSWTWKDGSEILIRGELVRLSVVPEGELQVVQFADHVLTLPSQITDLRPFVERHLWSLAEKELTSRTYQLAAQHELTLRRVVVRNQRTRWGSCSPRRTISLNWRLIQAPAFVRDYLILHELMHLREMNHSERFWRWVASACPDYEKAESWLDQHAHLLR